MRTIPTSAELVGIVKEAILNGDLPAKSYGSRVASNVLGIVQREIEHAPQTDAGIVSRLTPILRRTGSAAELEQRLASEMAAGRITAETEGLIDHLWQTQMDEMAIDQPRYATYRRCLEETAEQP